MGNERTSEALNRRNSTFDNRLRPVEFSEFVGQQKIRDRLMLAVQAAKDAVTCVVPVKGGYGVLLYVVEEEMTL